jgi:hypothetical protein
MLMQLRTESKFIILEFIIHICFLNNLFLLNNLLFCIKTKLCK